MRTGEGGIRLHWLVGGLVCALSMTGFAIPVTFNVDPAHSTLVLAGTFAGYPLQTITFGSSGDPLISNGFTTSYEGAITADRDLSAGSLRITGGDVLAQINPFLVPSPEAFNYSFYTPYGPVYPVSSTFQGEIRGFSMRIGISSVFASPSFDASEIPAAIASGRLDWAIVSTNLLTIPPTEARLDGSSTLAGDLFFAPASATLMDVDGIETLSIPISTEFLTQANLEPVILQLTGTIVATRTIPEPQQLLPLGVIVLFSRQTRRALAVSGS
jgi:hypothetical protein